MSKYTVTIYVRVAILDKNLRFAHRWKKSASCRFNFKTLKQVFRCLRTGLKFGRDFKFTVRKEVR